MFHPEKGSLAISKSRTLDIFLCWTINDTWSQNYHICENDQRRWNLPWLSLADSYHTISPGASVTWAIDVVYADQQSLRISLLFFMFTTLLFSVCIKTVIVSITPNSKFDILDDCFPGCLEYEAANLCPPFDPHWGSQIQHGFQAWWSTRSQSTRLLVLDHFSKCSFLRECWFLTYQDEPPAKSC